MLNDKDKADLTALWHTARIALSGPIVLTAADRVIWAAREWDKTHPGQRLAAYRYLILAVKGYGY